MPSLKYPGALAGTIPITNELPLIKDIIGDSPLDTYKQILAKRIYNACKGLQYKDTTEQEAIDKIIPTISDISPAIICIKQECNMVNALGMIVNNNISLLSDKFSAASAINNICATIPEYFTMLDNLGLLSKLSTAAGLITYISATIVITNVLIVSYNGIITALATTQSMASPCLNINMPLPVIIPDPTIIITDDYQII